MYTWKTSSDKPSVLYKSYVGKSTDAFSSSAVSPLRPFMQRKPFAGDRSNGSIRTAVVNM